jgi:hypothetical protein
MNDKQSGFSELKIPSAEIVSVCRRESPAHAADVS